VQRLLWASTSTKNPSFSNLKYVEALIGRDTVNTVTIETLDAYRQHGRPKARLEDDVEHAAWVSASLGELGISINQITQELETRGVEKFNHAFDKLIDALKAKSDRRKGAESRSRLR
jgi:transaldolase